MKRFIGTGVLWLLGWRAEGAVPEGTKAVVVGHPHTSSWDFPLFVFVLWSLDLRMSWLGKQDLFTGPFGWLFHVLGGVPVDRSGGKDTVTQIVTRFEEGDLQLLGMAPSGTRQRTEYWRSGIYHVALAANVPLLCGSIDYVRRVGGILGEVPLTGDMAKDMDAIRAVYVDVQGRNPDRQSPIRFREEVTQTPADHSPQNR